MKRHQPERGDAVETWIREKRDEYGEGRAWDALDELLDDYRLLADTGEAISYTENMEEEQE